MTPIEKAKLCLATILERKAVDPILLHVEDLTTVADYFLNHRRKFYPAGAGDFPAPAENVKREWIEGIRN